MSDFITDSQGRKRYCGYKPADKPQGRRHGAAPVDVIPRVNWEAADFSAFSGPHLDQKQTLACVGFASCAVFTTRWELDRREPDQEFSPWFVYHNVNGGFDQGADIENGIKS